MVFEYKSGNKDVPCDKHKTYSSKLKFRLVVLYPFRLCYCNENLHFIELLLFLLEVKNG